MAKDQRELYLSELPDGSWHITGHANRDTPNPTGPRLIIEGTQGEVAAAIAGRLDLSVLPQFYQSRLKTKGFVGIIIPELLRYQK